MNSLIILRVFLWINRILGITFGGITIDDNSKPLVNKWFQLYGYSTVLLHIGFDVKFLLTMSEYTIDEFKARVPNLSDSARSTLFVLTTFTIIVQLIFKECAIIYLNMKSGQVIKFLVKILKYDRKYSTNVKLCCIMMFLPVTMIVLIIILLMSIETYTSKGYFHAFYSLAHIFIVAYYCWIITFSVCVFSIIYDDRLDKLIENLKHFVEFKLTPTSSHHLTSHMIICSIEKIKPIKSEYIEIRRDVTSVDSCLSFMISFRILLSIYFLMINAYDISIISIEPNMKSFLKLSSFTTITSTAE